MSPFEIPSCALSLKNPSQPTFKEPCKHFSPTNLTIKLNIPWYAERPEVYAKVNDPSLQTNLGSLHSFLSRKSWRLVCMSILSSKKQKESTTRNLVLSLLEGPAMTLFFQNIILRSQKKTEDLTSMDAASCCQQQMPVRN